MATARPTSAGFHGVDRRPYEGVDAHLRGLACAAEGFGSQAIGGRDGPVHTVTSLEDSGPGTLREACGLRQPLWITFGQSGTIRLATPIRMPSHVTIDGRGQRVTLSGPGAGLQLRGSRHVIVCCVSLAGGRGHDADGVQMKGGCEHVWVDRCSLEDFEDGLVDITRGSTDVTISSSDVTSPATIRPC